METFPFALRPRRYSHTALFPYLIIRVREDSNLVNLDKLDSCNKRRLKLSKDIFIEIIRYNRFSFYERSFKMCYLDPFE